MQGLSMYYKTLINKIWKDEHPSLILKFCELVFLLHNLFELNEVLEGLYEICTQAP
ncbi:unnamed protein product [Moneuplotes crassus]|uniref:Uncharacterized protein n=1 Tax=Euplotes crassus TaxID=5936 RepID=A0AAD1YCK2_EUPCR|nr:unnamed protein product [Moneuplotes crassus]